MVGATGVGVTIGGAGTLDQSAQVLVSETGAGGVVGIVGTIGVVHSCHCDVVVKGTGDEVV